MSRRPLYLAAPVLLASALGYLAWPSSAPPKPGAAAGPGEAAVVAPATRTRSTQARSNRYRLVAEQRATVDGQQVAAVAVTGTWIETERAEGRIEVQLDATRITAEGDELPPPSAVASPFVLEIGGGRLTGIAFPEAVPPKGRDLLGGLATALQRTVREGEAWTADEEDLSGVYQAAYTRAGDTITRKRGRYTATRGPKGLVPELGDVLVSDERSVFVLDAEGLVSATVKVDQSSQARKGLPTVRTSLRVTLVREGSSRVALTGGPALTPAAITSHVDHAAARRKRLASLVGGARAPELIADVRAAAHLDDKAPDTGSRRNKALRRLAAQVQLDGGAAAEVAAAVREAPGDRRAVGLLSGALASARSADATDALSSVLAEPLPADSRGVVLASLALADTPTAESVSTLRAALDGPLGNQAALALGAQAGKLAGDGAGSDAIQELIQRYQAATTPADKRAYLEALANTASRDALPTLLSAIEGDDFGLACLGAYGLRLIPGDDVDDELWDLVRTGSPVMFQALQAVGYRSPALWLPRLAEAQVTFKDQKRVVEAIRALLTHWSHLKTTPAP